VHDTLAVGRNGLHTQSGMNTGSCFYHVDGVLLWHLDQEGLARLEQKDCSFSMAGELTDCVPVTVSSFPSKRREYGVLFDMLWTET